MDNSFDFLYSEHIEEKPTKVVVTPITCGEMTEEEFEEAMQWLFEDQ